MSMLLGGHFHIGYVWAAAGRGATNSACFGAVMVAVFGRGRRAAGIPLDRELWRSEPAPPALTQRRAQMSWLP